MSKEQDIGRIEGILTVLKIFLGEEEYDENGNIKMVNLEERIEKEKNE